MIQSHFCVNCEHIPHTRNSFVTNDGCSACRECENSTDYRQTKTDLLRTTTHHPTPGDTDASKISKRYCGKICRCRFLNKWKSFKQLLLPKILLQWKQVVHLFPTNFGQSACNSVKVKPISTLQLPNHARPAAEQPNRRNCLHYFRNACRLNWPEKGVLPTRGVLFEPAYPQAVGRPYPRG